jgi:dTDP-3-amino-3,4,6-trideoxy-alpha-D-glucose transaminase
MFAIPMNDRRAQWQALGADVLEAVEQLAAWHATAEGAEQLESGAHSPVRRALTTIAGLLRVPHVVGCASALDALEIALRAVGIAPGDKVLVSSVGDLKAVRAIVRTGAIPVFVDVDRSGLIDLQAVEAALHKGPSIRHMLAVHAYGHALDLRRLERLRREYRLRLVEDASHAVRACSRGTPVATVGQANAAGFEPAASLSALREVGAVLTTDPELAQRARALAQLESETDDPRRDRQSALGLHSPLDSLHATILERAILPRVETWIARRRAIAERYLAELDHPRIQALPVPQGSDSVWSAFPIRVEAADHHEPDPRADLAAHLAQHGVASEPYCPRPLPELRALASVPFEVHGALTQARALCRHMLTLPIHPYMTDEHVSCVIATVDAWARPAA